METDAIAPFFEVIEEIKAAGGDVYKFCYQCGKCDAVCPWNNVRNFSIRKIIREAAFGLTEIESEDIWRCTTCGNCPEKCPRGVKQIDLGVSLRKLASTYDVFPASARPARAVRGSLTTEGNPLNEARAKRADWAKDLSVKPFAEGTEVLFFGCCYLSYDPRMKKVAQATARILNKAGVDFGILGSSESCCGESIRKTGAEDIYKGLARENIKAFIDHGVRKIVVSSPHCYETFKNEYSDFMVHFEVVHMTQFLSELIRDGKLELTGTYDRPVTYHDPCYLGRHNDIYDAPREMLQQVPGLTLREMADVRNNSLCCGGGGGRVWMDTPKGERFSDLRLDQARDAGAEVLVTACPYCITMFEDSRLNLEYEDVLEIKDITEIIAEVI
ncbi:MAG: (Fe-S)-binding protein [Myxococcota bacterium]|nr:(Fe-S)-binding protein [Myxococcota bacterium]